MATRNVVITADADQFIMGIQRVVNGLNDLRAVMHTRRVEVQQATFAAYRHGWHVAAAGGMLCDCATSDEAAGWQASRDADAAMRRCEVR